MTTVPERKLFVNTEIGRMMHIFFIHAYFEDRTQIYTKTGRKANKTPLYIQASAKLTIVTFGAVVAKTTQVITTMPEQ